MTGSIVLPVLVGVVIVAAIDLKADRERRTLQVRHWTWIGKGAVRRHKKRIEAELRRFERFQAKLSWSSWIERHLAWPSASEPTIGTLL